MKKIIKLASLALLMSTAFSMSSCQKESNITRVCVLKTVDSMNLYLTGVAKGNLSSTYVYLGDADSNTETSTEKLSAYATEVFNKANKARPNCDTAFFPIKNDKEITVLKDFLKKCEAEIQNTSNRFKVVYIDCYADSSKKTSELTPTGVWVGRNGWIKNSGTSKKFVAGLAKTAKYRRDEMVKYNEKGDVIKKTTNDAFEMAYRDFADMKWNTFAEMYNYIDQNQSRLPDFMFNDKNDKIVNYKSIFEYTALFAIQNKQYFSGTVKDVFVNTCARNTANPYITNDQAESLFGEIKDISKTTETDKPITDDGATLLNNLSKTLDLGDDYTKSIETNLMRYGNYQAAHPSTSSGNMKQVILISSIGGGVLLIVIGLLIFRRIKTGKKLFDVRRALDVDIALDDPRVIRRKDVAQDLKAIRIGLGLSIEDAAYLMRIPAKFLEKDLEGGEIMIPKRLRSRFISCYNLPTNYFNLAYNADDK